jgi:hypothetical protein
MFRTPRRALVALCLAASAPVVAHADVALDWFSTSEEATAKVAGARGDRARVIAWLAAFNALNAIDPRYQPYPPAPAPLSSAAPRPSTDAALAAAIYTALVVEPDADQALLVRRYRETLAGVKSAPEREAGAMLGQQAALMLLVARSADRLARVAPPAREPEPGVFVSPADAKMARSIALASLAPFGVRSAQDFDPGPPPAAGSDAAAREIAQVRAIGAVASTTRSADQTAAALFWNSGDGEFATLFKAALESRKLDDLELARIAALDAMISIDSGIAGSAWKERYLRWRPETAIAGALAAERDAGWRPLVPAPNSPDYPSSGGIGAGTLEVELPRLLALTGPISLTNRQTGQTRRWPDAAAMADELAAARVWAGVHFRSAVDAGRRVGRGVASEIVERQLSPR